jgi:hypothetical protein
MNEKAPVEDVKRLAVPAREVVQKLAPKTFQTHTP